MLHTGFARAVLDQHRRPTADALPAEHIAHLESQRATARFPAWERLVPSSGGPSWPASWTAALDVDPGAQRYF